VKTPKPASIVPIDAISAKQTIQRSDRAARTPIMPSTSVTSAAGTSQGLAIQADAPASAPNASV
jgi:hypothetical protein